MKTRNDNIVQIYFIAVILIFLLISTFRFYIDEVNEQSRKTQVLSNTRVKAHPPMSQIE